MSVFGRVICSFRILLSIYNTLFLILKKSSSQSLLNSILKFSEKTMTFCLKLNQCSEYDTVTFTLNIFSKTHYSDINCDEIQMKEQKALANIAV